MNDVTDAALRRGQALLGLGRAREAEELLRTALADQPDDTMVQVLLAQALLRQEKYAEAHDVSRGALAAEPENVFAHAIHAGSLAGLSRHPEALTAIRRGIALAPHLAGLHLQEASILLADDRAKEALACVKKARALDPEDSGGAALQAAALHDAGRFAEADVAVAEALRLDPENADAHRIQGLLALRRGGGKSAIRSQRTALRLDPTDKGARDGLFIALKTRNPLYAQLLRFQLWLGTLPKGVRIAVLIAPFILTRVLQPFNGQTWATVLLVVSIGLVVLSWTLEPIMNCVLLLSRDRHVVDRPARVATSCFLAFGAAAIVCAVVGATDGPARLLGLAFALGLWAMATGLTHTVSPGMRKIVLIGAAAGAVLAAVAAVAIVAGAPGAIAALALVFISGIVATWVTALA